MSNIDEWYESIEMGIYPIDDEEEVIDKREFVDNDGNDIFKKKSEDKTVEERIKTSRTLKIKYNKWNQVDYSDDFSNDKIVIDPNYNRHESSFGDIEFEKKFHEIIENSKYKSILLGDEKVTINYQIMNDILLYCYARLKKEYSLTRVFVMLCEYANLNIQTMWKRLSSYIQMKMLEELQEFSKLPNEILDEENKLF